MDQPLDNTDVKPQINNGDTSMRSPTAPTSLSSNQVNIPGLDEHAEPSPPASTMPNQANDSPPKNAGIDSKVDETGEVRNVWSSDLAPNAPVSCQYCLTVFNLADVCMEPAYLRGCLI